MKVESFHPFKSEQAKQEYLEFYDQRAEEWTGGEIEGNMTDGWGRRVESPNFIQTILRRVGFE